MRQRVKYDRRNCKIVKIVQAKRKAILQHLLELTVWLYRRSVRASNRRDLSGRLLTIPSLRNWAIVSDMRGFSPAVSSSLCEMYVCYQRPIKMKKVLYNRSELVRASDLSEYQTCQPVRLKILEIQFFWTLRVTALNPYSHDSAILSSALQSLTNKPYENTPTIL